MRKRFSISIIIGIIICVLGYYFFITVLGEKEIPGELSESCGAVQTDQSVEEGVGRDTEVGGLIETELAGRDTCTVLPEKIELADGVLCEVLDDTPFVAEEEPINYRCSDGNWLAGQPDKTEKVWTIRQVLLSPGEGDPVSRISQIITVKIGKVWR